MGKHLENVKQMLKGEHKTQQKKIFGFEEGKKASADYNVGDTWEEKDQYGNITYCRKEPGYIVRDTALSLSLRKLREELASFPKCQKTQCDADPYNRANVKTRVKTGMCMTCLTRYEDDIRLAGKWKEYEQTKMMEKATSIFKSTDDVLEEYIAPFKRGYYEEVLADGSVKKHQLDPGMADQIVKDYEEYKELVLDEIGR